MPCLLLVAPEWIEHSLTRCQKPAHYRYAKEQNVNELYYISYNVYLTKFHNSLISGDSGSRTHTAIPDQGIFLPHLLLHKLTYLRPTYYTQR